MAADERGSGGLPTLLLLWIVLYLAGLGALDVQGSLEGLRIVVARSMVESGDWVVPSFAGEPYLLKPPLVNWAIASSGLVAGGFTAFATRLPSALAVLATSLLLVAWGRRRGSTRAGRTAGIVYLFLPLVFEKGIRAEIESVLTLCVALGLLALYEATRGRRGAPRPPGAAWWMQLAALGIALGFLAKGPPALLMAAATALPWLAWRGWRALAPLGLLGGVVVFVAVLSAWVIPLVSAVGWDSLKTTIDVEVLQRAQAADPGNREPFWYYLPKLIGGALPAVLLLPGLRSREVRRRHAPALLYLALWVVVPLVLFSFFSGKESRYLLPLYPALALLAGFGAEGLLVMRPHLAPRLRRLGFGLLLLAVIVKIVWIAAVVPHKNERKSPRRLAQVVSLRVPEARTITFVGKPRAQLLYYLDRPIRHVDDVEALLGKTPLPSTVLVPVETTPTADLERLRQALPGATIENLTWGEHPYRLIQTP